MKCLVRVRSTGLYYGPPGRMARSRKTAHVYSEDSPEDKAHLLRMFQRRVSKKLLVLEVLHDS